MRTAPPSGITKRIDPALVLHEDCGVRVLAPGRDYLGRTPERKPAASDFRASVQTGRPWLQLMGADQSLTDDSAQKDMFAVLPGNSKRLYLEAVLLADSPVQRANSSYEAHLAARMAAAAAPRAWVSPGPQRLAAAH